MNLPFYTVSALFWGYEVKLCTALWINWSVVLGFIQCFPQAKSQLCFGFLALIPFFHRSTTSSAERIYCYYPIGEMCIRDRGEAVIMLYYKGKNGGIKMGYQIYCGKGFDTQKAERFFKERRVAYQRVDVLKYGIGRRELELSLIHILRQRRRVLLPEPLRPMTATTSPLSTRTVTPFKISLSPYFFLMSIA